MQARTTSDDRGQTPQDFAIGMSIFLLAVVTVLAFIPSIFTPFTAPADAVEGQAAAAFATSLGLESYRSVNVSIVTLNGSNRSDVVTIAENGNTTPLTAGEPYDDQPSSTMVRVVRIENLCEPGCRMVVRVW